jgi:hypothetical protein
MYYRKKTQKVFLNIYDYTKLNSCLKYIGMAGYHTGIEIG